MVGEPEVFRDLPELKQMKDARSALKLIIGTTWSALKRREFLERWSRA